MIVQLMFAAAVGVTAAAPGAPAPTSSAPAKSAPGKQASNKMICKNQETTGSRLGGLRVCMTRAQWDERAAGNGAVAAGWQQQSYQSGVPN